MMAPSGRTVGRLIPKPSQRQMMGGGGVRNYSSEFPNRLSWKNYIAFTEITHEITHRQELNHRRRGRLPRIDGQRTIAGGHNAAQR